MPPAWFAIPLGLGLILLSVLDIFLTVLHVQAESPLSNRANRVVWLVLLAATRPLRRRARDQILAWGMPLMIVAVLTLWIVLYVVGFALLYAVVIHNSGFFSAQSPPAEVHLGDALYFSAVTFFTVGYGDLVPLHPVPRLLAAVESGSGLLAIALAVAYLLAVYPYVARTTALATALNQETAGRPDGVATAERYLAAGRSEALAERLRYLNDELLALGQAHSLYPVLYYVRPTEVHESFVRILVIAQGLVATLRYVVDPEAHPEIGQDPRLVMLEEGLLYTLHNLQHSTHLRVDVGATGADDWSETLACLRADLRSRGIAVADEPAAAERFGRFRLATDPYIQAYARNTAYELGKVWATYGRWTRGSSLTPH